MLTYNVADLEETTIRSDNNVCLVRKLIDQLIMEEIIQEIYKQKTKLYRKPPRKKVDNNVAF